MMGGIFNQISSENSLIVDPLSDPKKKTQEKLKTEVEAYEELSALDYKFCLEVEGAAQENNLWVSRNQADSGFEESDLQRFKNVAWSECVVKKYLANREATADMIGSSMINIIRSLNL